MFQTNINSNQWQKIMFTKQSVPHISRTWLKAVQPSLHATSSSPIVSEKFDSKGASLCFFFTSPEELPFVSCVGIFAFSVSVQRWDLSIRASEEQTFAPNNTPTNQGKHHHPQQRPTTTEQVRSRSRYRNWATHHHRCCSSWVLEKKSVAYAKQGSLPPWLPDTPWNSVFVEAKAPLVWCGSVCLQ